MDNVYLVYNDLGYDGIDIVAICTTLKAAHKAALEGDLKCTREIVIEEWMVNKVAHYEQQEQPNKHVCSYVNGKLCQ